MSIAKLFVWWRHNLQMTTFTWRHYFSLICLPPVVSKVDDGMLLVKPLGVFSAFFPRGCRNEKEESFFVNQFIFIPSESHFSKTRVFLHLFQKLFFCEHSCSTGVKVGLPLLVNVCVFVVVVGFAVISLVEQNKIFCNPLIFFKYRIFKRNFRVIIRVDKTSNL